MRFTRVRDRTCFVSTGPHLVTVTAKGQEIAVPVGSAGIHIQDAQREDLPGDE